ncbi:cytochrome c biogenesis CcdA family protein [Microbulbifer sp. VAAC004]|uniref:cytochrome c biogenesis CcdA family protein n=1 Tax=unclassified Microbulbifer TaxID=2619833 RepID=UPI0040392E06
MLEVSAIPLALIAGTLSILSPCVWPLVPMVVGASSSAGRWGPYALAVGLSLSFALAGTVLSFLLVSLGLDPELFRYIAAILLVAVALILLIKPLSDWVTLRLSKVTAGASITSDGAWAGQFGIGFLTGIIWLPCVGPTLGAAIALASMGQQLGQSFMVMFSFGLGTGAALLVAGGLSRKIYSRLSPSVGAFAVGGKVALGAILLLLGIMVLSGFDKVLETWALNWIPEWTFSF